MGSCRPKEVDVKSQPSEAGSTLARALAPEDVRPGDYVALLHEICDYPSFYWCADSTLLPPDQPVRIRFTPNDESIPLKVKSVCLPFVLVMMPWRGKRTLDLRKCRLARLDKRYAAAAWKVYKKKPTPKAGCGL
jgi:hypothetical protein